MHCEFLQQSTVLKSLLSEGTGQQKDKNKPTITANAVDWMCPPKVIHWSPNMMVFEGGFGGWGWSQNHTGMDPGYGTGRRCECRQLFSLCLCTVDSERVLPKSPWIPLTNVVRSSPTLTWFVPFIAGPSEDHYGLLRPLHWKKLRGLEVLGVYSAWGSDGRWCNGIKVQWPWLHAGQALLWNSPPEILLQIRLRLTSNPRAAVTLLHHVSFTSTPISSGNTFVFLIINFTIE